MTQAKAPQAAPAAEQDSPDADKTEVGRRIKQQRERHGWTLDELSQATKQIDPQLQGVSKVSISRYENADSYPGYREIKLIAHPLMRRFHKPGDEKRVLIIVAPDEYDAWLDCKEPEFARSFF